MTDAAEIRTLCVQLGLGQCGLDSVKAWISAGLHHLEQPGCLEEDARWAMNHTLRAASVRIACQGRAGHPIWLGRVMSQEAAKHLDTLVKSADPRRARTEWPRKVTFEHQERVQALQDWAVSGHEAKQPVDAIVRRLLQYPAVLITIDEDKKLNSMGLRKRGDALERYSKAGIMTVVRPHGAAEALGLRGRKDRFAEAPFVPFPAAGGSA